MMEEKKYTQLSIEPAKGQDQTRVDVRVKLTNTQEFMLTSLLSMKILAKKLNMNYESILRLMCAYLKSEDIADEALARVEEIARENGVDSL